jgi:hypothetical protein
MKQLSRLLLLGLTALCLPRPCAQALVVTTDPGVDHTADPGTGWAWDNVGQIGGVNGASGVFLGTYDSGSWVLTATHVGAGNFTVGGQTYAPVAGSARALKNFAGVAGDLMIYQIAAAPDLPTIALSEFAPVVGSPIVLAGYGFTGVEQKTYWQVSGGTWTETADPSLAQRSGYFQNGRNGLTWGTGAVLGYFGYSVGTGPTTGMFTRFADTPGSAQGAGGDSGGAVFFQNAQGGWELTGILSGVVGTSGQPGGTSVFGNMTAAASIGTYYGDLAEIMEVTAIPEPSSWAALVGAVGLVAAVARNGSRASQTRRARQMQK